MEDDVQSEIKTEFTSFYDGKVSTSKKLRPNAIRKHLFLDLMAIWISYLNKVGEQDVSRWHLSVFIFKGRVISSKNAENPWVDDPTLKRY